MARTGHAEPKPVMRWISGLRDRLAPTTYVDSSDVPDLPEPPYRARLSIPLEQGADGVEVREREVVRGKMRTIYEVHCPCGKRWFNPRLETVQLCPRCNRAVVLNPPGTSMP